MMTTKSEKDRAKQIQDKCQSVLNELLRDEDNKYCVDCDTKGPRWASWNLGVFLCIRCAGIHRNLGVHISKVKSVNLDTWTPEQVVSLQQMGNSRARAVYEANLPDNFRRPQTDSSLESFVRAKYEHKKYIAREWVPPPLPKVNWEKEIDEEIERQKRKKNKYSDSKNKITLNTKSNTEIPQLPKPKSASSSNTTNSSATKGGSASPKPSAKLSDQSGTSKSNVDLLKLDNTQQNNDKQADDAFSSFLSAPSEPAKNDKTEEENFFNQPAPTEKEKTQLTKDSILALYGNAPNQPIVPAVFQQNYSNQFPPTGNFPNTFAQNIGTAPFPQTATTGYAAFNGFSQFAQPQPAFGPGGTVVAANTANFVPNFGVPPATMMPTQPFGALSNGAATQPQLFPNTQATDNFFQPAQCFGGIPATATQQQPFAATAAVGMSTVRPTVQNVVPNPFLTQPPSVNIQQQFANMSLNNIQQTPKVPTNVWQ